MTQNGRNFIFFSWQRRVSLYTTAAVRLFIRCTQAYYNESVFGCNASERRGSLVQNHRNFLSLFFFSLYASLGQGMDRSWGIDYTVPVFVRRMFAFLQKFQFFGGGVLFFLCLVFFFFMVWLVWLCCRTQPVR